MHLHKKSSAVAVALLAAAFSALGIGSAAAQDGNIGSGVNKGFSMRLQTDYQASEKASWAAPAATRIALSTRGAPPSQSALAAELGATSGTSETSRVTSVLNAHGAGAYHAVAVTTPMSTADQTLLSNRIEDSISSSRPIVAEFRIRSGDTPPGYHLTGSSVDTYVTITGFDKPVRGGSLSAQEVLVVDPASTTQRYWVTWQGLMDWLAPGGYTYY